MKIKFPIDKFNYDDKELFYGEKKRYSSMTSIVFITKNILVCSSFHNRKIYLIEFDLDKEKYNLLHSTDSIGLLNKPFSTDLIDFNGKYIVTSNL